jgi:hypothetical protein
MQLLTAVCHFLHLDPNHQHYRPEFDHPLGAPLADAVKVGFVWTRRFARGTNVTWDANSYQGTISWGNGVVQVGRSLCLAFSFVFVAHLCWIVVSCRLVVSPRRVASRAQVGTDLSSVKSTVDSKDFCFERNGILFKPTPAPTPFPTIAPTAIPTKEPGSAPTEAPTDAPTDAPTENPTELPTEAPTSPSRQNRTEARTNETAAGGNSGAVDGSIEVGSAKGGSSSTGSESSDSSKPLPATVIGVVVGGVCLVVLIALGIVNRQGPKENPKQPTCLWEAEARQSDSTTGVSPGELAAGTNKVMV